MHEGLAKQMLQNGCEAMGIYLNPGIDGFEITVNSDIYVDKTEMITYLNSVLKTEKRYVSVSRPRRFGKSIAANMLCAYQGSLL